VHSICGARAKATPKNNSFFLKKKKREREREKNNTSHFCTSSMSMVLDKAFLKVIPQKQVVEQFF